MMKMLAYYKAFINLVELVSLFLLMLLHYDWNVTLLLIVAALQKACHSGQHAGCMLASHADDVIRPHADPRL